MRAIIVFLVVGLLSVSGLRCAESSDSNVGRTTGTITGVVNFIGEWPAVGTVMIAAFTVAPWSEGFVPGPPTGTYYFEEPATFPAEVEFTIENLPFKEYGSLAIAWTDPENPDAATRDHPLSVIGIDPLDLMAAGRSGGATATIELLNTAPSFEITPEDPDAFIIDPTDVYIFDAESLRMMFPSIGDMLGY
jgi:hypothetical protein